MEGAMPGSFPDPRSYTNVALEALEEAYELNHESHTGSLILKAIEAIRRLKQEINGHSAGAAEFDPHELNDFNSAI
jgi:hypothetical protein